MIVGSVLRSQSQGVHFVTVKTFLLAWAAVCLIGCKSKTPVKATPLSPIALYVDGKKSGTITLPANSDKKALEDLLPNGSPALRSVALVVAHRGKDKLRFADPNVADGRLYLTRGADGQVALAMYREPKKQMPKRVADTLKAPTSKMAGIESIHLHTEKPPATARPAPPFVSLTGSDRKVHLTKENLAKVKATKGRGTKGWDLAGVVALVLDGNPAESVELRAEDGQTIKLSKKDLASPGQIRIVRRNQRGVWMYRQVPAVDGKREDRVELRALTELLVSPQRSAK